MVAVKIQEKQAVLEVPHSRFKLRLISVLGLKMILLDNIQTFLNIPDMVLPDIWYTRISGPYGPVKF